ncbi:MAG: HAD hydrolase-like protein [Bacilli bacterium]|nr:HAD hydrolase-like protein [Bacilli bacterium]
MIKVIAFDLVGVLIGEKNIKLETIEEKLERLFGPNLSDLEYLKQAKKISNLTDKEIIDITKNIINKLYTIKDDKLINKLREKYPNIKIVIATNHVSYIREYLINNFNVDNIIISAEINKIKPNIDFYKEVSNITKTNIEEILFVDDNIDNVNGALSSGMKAIKIDRHDSVYEKVINKLV